MAHDPGADLEPSRLLDRWGFELVVEDRFTGPELDAGLWIPAYLPQWSASTTAAARYGTGGRGLRLRIDLDQGPWCPEFDGELRVSSLQTGVRSGPLGSGDGQHRFRDGLVVREVQPTRALFTPMFGLVEARMRALDDPADMVALWMIGFEDAPDHSAEICIAEIFGRDVDADRVAVGMGVRQLHDPSITGDWERVSLDIDPREPHDYAAVWTASYVAFYVDERLVKVVRQSPRYPMQLMLGIFEFVDGEWPPSPPSSYPKTFEVEWVRGYRPAVRGGVSR